MDNHTPRFFKTRLFAKRAAKARISDQELFQAGTDLTQGKGANLGGGVWKKRLNKNLHRSIVVEKVAAWWFFIYLYAKRDRENIDQAEEAAFKRLAAQYAVMQDAQLDELLMLHELLEIFSHDDQAPLQERCV
ncbi:MAG: type II toxin-antitoxin system RelE/ParE family toxin [Castellaniella sp.]|uniref:type II toxin-antitoxin system RelE/ParE family toxin n=1 Tax=Castellaniella sp. TaxID=1955812 RepID=UPI002A3647B5|nr:type II toxin-antitoxin system RelE/ParE family toxin [Castellaniella sp.]MDY0310121.1 type II toxin-antitoxin system RelE/ParE family toxin [Castellaniella sp.]